MTPVFLNLPSSDHLIFSDHHQVEQKDQDQQLKLFINNNSQYNYEASSSLSSPATFFNSISTTATTTQDLQSGIGDVIIGLPQLRDQKAVIDDVFTSRSKNLSICQRDDHHQGVNIDFNGEYQDDQNNISSEIKINYNNGPSVKYWMSSKLRLMQKMSNQELPPAAEITSDHKLGMSSSTPSEQDEAGEAIIFNFSRSNSTSTTTTALPAVRVCSDCNTTSTPLWRSGPRGPKSLCNACGIRQRKARRAMAEAAAANGLVVAADYTPIKTGTTASNYYKTQFHINKEKKSRISNIAQYKNKLKLKLIDTSSTSSSTTSPRSERKDNVNNNNHKLCLSKFSFGLNDKYCSAFSGVFPKDVAEAAVLLMEMSCGFVHS